MLSDNSLPNMMIQSKTNYHLSLINNHLAFGIFTLVEESLQINLFMQNKAKFRKSQMNVNKVLTKDYEQQTLGERGKNKANSNPIKANSKPISPETKPIQTQYKPKQSQFQTAHLLINRVKSKLLNFHPKNSLTNRRNSLKSCFLVVNGRLL